VSEKEKRNEKEDLPYNSKGSSHTNATRLLLMQAGADPPASPHPTGAVAFQRGRGRVELAVERRYVEPEQSGAHAEGAPEPRPQTGQLAQQGVQKVGRRQQPQGVARRCRVDQHAVVGHA
jgi:hypothetical protein